MIPSVSYVDTVGHLTVSLPFLEEASARLPVTLQGRKAPHSPNWVKSQSISLDFKYRFETIFSYSIWYDLIFLLLLQLSSQILFGTA